MIIFAIIIFVLSLLTIASIFLLRFSQVSQRPSVRVRLASAPVHHSIHLWTYFKSKFKIIAQHIWHFVLEAKDLKPATTKTIQHQYQRVKSAFRIRIRTSEQEPLWLPEAAELSVRLENRNPEDQYLEAIKKNPTDKQAYESLGRHYLQMKNYAEAAETYEYLIKLDPARDIYFSNLGLSYYSLNEYQKAAASYEKAIGINGKIPTRWINLGLCFLALDELPRAIKAFAQAVTLDKLNVNYLTLLADAYIKIENPVRAEEVLEQILVLEPTNRTAREKLMKLKI